MTFLECTVEMARFLAETVGVGRVAPLVKAYLGRARPIEPAEGTGRLFLKKKKKKKKRSTRRGIVIYYIALRDCNITARDCSGKSHEGNAKNEYGFRVYGVVMGRVFFFLSLKMGDDKGSLDEVEGREKAGSPFIYVYAQNVRS